MRDGEGTMNAHADLATLLSYWLGELDESREAALEEHYLGCAECSARLGEVEALATGVRRAYSRGLVHAIVTPGFVEQLRSRGLRIREYHVALNGSVNCSLGPDDQALFGHLHAPLAGVDRVDAIFENVVSPAKAGAQSPNRIEDVPFDAAAGEVVLAPSVERLREMGTHRHAVRLVAVGVDGERVIGDYTFNHSASA